jgi:hypothetical protein
MSIVACVKVYDGIVIGAESMTQLLANVQVPGAPPGAQHQSLHIKSYSNAQKIFQIARLPIGVLTYGAGNIGNRSMESFVHEFSDEETASNDQQGDRSVQAIASRLLAFMRRHYDPAFANMEEAQRPVTGFYIAGYSPAQHLGSEWEFVLPQAHEVTRVREEHLVGASWRGISVPFTRVFFGADPRIEQILVSLGMNQEAIARFRQVVGTQLISRVAFDGMPLQDAIGFCKFIIDTTIGMATYEIGNPSCGGPVNVAVITRSGFEWVSKPQFRI